MSESVKEPSLIAEKSNASLLGSASAKHLEALKQAILEISDPSPFIWKKTHTESVDELFEAVAKAKLDLAKQNELAIQTRAAELNAESIRQLLHDLHNPVAALRQMVRLLKEESIDKDTKQQALESVPRIATQILRQVTVARSHLNLPAPQLNTGDLRQSLMLAAKDMPTAILRMPKQPVTVKHDAQLMKTAVCLLLANAEEASRSRVELSLETTDNCAVIRVADDGPGIDEGNVTLFLQGRGGGTGLSTVSHIVNSHNGKVVYRTSEWNGACFEIRLELVPMQEVL